MPGVYSPTAVRPALTTPSVESPRRGMWREDYGTAWDGPGTAWDAAPTLQDPVQAARPVQAAPVVERPVAAPAVARPPARVSESSTDADGETSGWRKRLWKNPWVRGGTFMGMGLGVTAGSVSGVVSGPAGPVIMGLAGGVAGAAVGAIAGVIAAGLRSSGKAIARGWRGLFGRRDASATSESSRIAPPEGGSRASRWFGGFLGAAVGGVVGGLVSGPVGGILGGVAGGTLGYGLATATKRPWYTWCCRSKSATPDATTTRA